MNRRIIGSSLVSMAALAFFLGCAEADEASRMKILDRMMYTINPAAKIEGPAFRDQANEAERSQYASSIVALILKEADSKARKYLEAGDNQAYYAFMILGLTVPLHEGVYVHFRNVDGDVCRPEANSGDLVKKAGATTYNIFNQYFKNPSAPFFPNCEEMKVTKGVKQMIRGGDGTDLSIMQVSIRWHFDDFLANKKYESVSQTLNYGFGILMNGFDPVYRNVADYKCIADAEGFFAKKKINYINLIKGIWAGKYNSGSIGQTCRFADPNSPYKKHDLGFARNLDKVLNFNGTIPADYIGDLKVEGLVADAVREVVSNLKENKNERKALNQLLDQ
ncbi:MAG: hypothetical protein ACXVLQ_15195 [Bacteriovorax sp.]